MSRSKPSLTERPLAITLATLALAAVLVVVASSPVIMAAHNGARTYAGRAEHTDDISAKIANLKIAHWLDAGNYDYSNHLADLYLLRSQPESAIEALQSLGDRGELRVARIQLQAGQYPNAAATAAKLPGAEARLVEARANLEIGEYGQAKASAQQAMQTPANAEEAHLLLAYCAGLAGEGSAAIIQAAGNVPSPEVASIAYGGLPLAASLYHHGLLATAQRVLAQTGENNSQRFRLQAAIQLAYIPSSRERLIAARDALLHAVGISPADIELHRQLRNVYERLGEGDNAASQDVLIQQLASGKL